MQNPLVYNLFSESSSEILIDINEVKKLINLDIENMTGCKLYNKQSIIDKIYSLDKSENIFKILKKEVSINLIAEISFNELFNTTLKLIFKEDNIFIYHNDIILESKDFSSFVNSIEHNYVISKMYLDNIITVLQKFVNKDLSVKYHCINIPKPYWKLFEIKCFKENPKATDVFNKYSFYDNIISGENYKKTEKIIQKILIENEDIDNNIKMEVFSYLNDVDFDYFLATIEKYESNQNNINQLIILLNDIINSASNKMIKFYFLNKLFKLIPLINNIVSEIHNIIIKKIDEFPNDIYIIQTAGLTLSDEIITSFTFAKEYIINLDNNMEIVD
jgi:hypothetical protein